MLAPTMKPKPPAWIRARITACPNPFQWSRVSTVASPVTAAAEVAVNRASTGEVAEPSRVAQGSERRTVPTRISAA